MTQNGSNKTTLGVVRDGLDITLKAVRLRTGSVSDELSSLLASYIKAGCFSNEGVTLLLFG